MPRPAIACADCGRPREPGRDSLPPGKARCQRCRRLRPSKPKPVKRAVSCGVCQLPFLSAHPHARYCGSACRAQAKLADPRPPSAADRARWARKGSASSRGYGADHTRGAKTMKAAMRDGDPCCRCDGPMYRWQLALDRNDPRGIDADHYALPHALGGDKADALAHRSCNRREGAILGNRLRGHRRHRATLEPVDDHEP